MYMVYDARDRLVYSQDANMRGRNQWTTTLYDVLIVLHHGMIGYSGNRDQLQTYVTSNTGSNSVARCLYLWRTGTLPEGGGSRHC